MRPAPCRALASPNDLGDVAGTLGLSLSGFEQVMGKASFGALLGASGVYCYKVSVVVRARGGARIAARETGASARGPSPGRPRPRARADKREISPTLLLGADDESASPAR